MKLVKDEPPHLVPLGKREEDGHPPFSSWKGGSLLEKRKAVMIAWEDVNIASALLLGAILLPEGIKDRVTWPSPCSGEISASEVEGCDHSHSILFPKGRREGGDHAIFPCLFGRCRSVASAVLFLGGESLLEKWRSVILVIPSYLQMDERKEGT